MGALSKYLLGAIAVAIGLCVIPAASMAQRVPTAGLASVTKPVAAAPTAVTHVAGSLAAKASPVARKAPPKPPPAVPAPTPTRPLTSAATRAAAPAASVVKTGTTQAAATATHAVSSGTGPIHQVLASGSEHVRQIAGAGVTAVKRTTAAATSTSTRAIGVVDSKLRSGVKAAKAAVSQVSQASHLHPTPGRSPQRSTSSRGRGTGQQTAPGTPWRAPGLTAPWQRDNQFGHPGEDPSFRTTQPGAHGTRSHGTAFTGQRATPSNAALLSAPDHRGSYGRPGSHGTGNGSQPGAVSTATTTGRGRAVEHRRRRVGRRRSGGCAPRFDLDLGGGDYRPPPSRRCGCDPAGASSPVWVSPGLAVGRTSSSSLRREGSRCPAKPDS